MTEIGDVRSKKGEKIKFWMLVATLRSHNGDAILNHTDVREGEWLLRFVAKGSQNVGVNLSMHMSKKSVLQGFDTS